ARADPGGMGGERGRVGGALGAAVHDQLAGPGFAEPLGDGLALLDPEQDALARRAEREDAVDAASDEEPRQRLDRALVHARAAVAERRHGSGEEECVHLHAILDETRRVGSRSWIRRPAPRTPW